MGGRRSYHRKVLRAGIALLFLGDEQVVASILGADVVDTSLLDTLLQGHDALGWSPNDHEVGNAKDEE